MTPQEQVTKVREEVFPPARKTLLGSTRRTRTPPDTPVAHWSLQVVRVVQELKSGGWICILYVSINRDQEQLPLVRNPTDTLSQQM